MALSLMGTEIKFTDGKISSKTGMQGDITSYQISVPIQPGNSGGPLFDYDGNLIGITTSTINRKYDMTENVNYAVKTSYLKNLIDVLRSLVKIGSEKRINFLSEGSLTFLNVNSDGTSSTPPNYDTRLRTVIFPAIFESCKLTNSEYKLRIDFLEAKIKELIS